MSSPSPLSSDAGRLPILTKAGLRLLAARYINGEFEARSWGKTQLLDEFWGEEPTDATITPLATTFAPLLAQLICAISAGGPTPAWVLRVVLTPEFLWLGLHQTAFSLMEVGNISPADICRVSPLVTAGVITTNLSYDESWVAQGVAMEQHLRIDPPAIYNIAVGTGDPNDINMDRPWTPVTPTFPEPLTAPHLITLPPIITLPPAPTKPKRGWQDGNPGEAEIETEERSTEMTGAKLGWVNAEYKEYETSSWRPSDGGTSNPSKRNSYRETR
ncbi:hypothetical protein N7504_010363 [Penicillium tannophilum]|nr:hypothetical protein N7504_010363 [Penicillium tannophilum]